MGTTKVKVGVDIGGTHISAALVDMEGKMLDGAYIHVSVDAMGEATLILDTWAKAISGVVALAGGAEVCSIGIAMPGPFDYEQGISLIKDMAKYEQLYGINIREALLDRVYPLQVPIAFHNDAVCFGQGTVAGNVTLQSARVLTITLGTGLGACYLDRGVGCLEGAGVPPRGFLYDYPFLDGKAEDYISARWLLKEYAVRSGEELPNVKALAELAATADIAKSVFHDFGTHLGQLLKERMHAFKGDHLVIGGSIAKSPALFVGPMREALGEGSYSICCSPDTEAAAISGAAMLAPVSKDGVKAPRRASKQPTLPRIIDPEDITQAGYRMYPFESLGAGAIFSGYASLASWIGDKKEVIIEGYQGVDWSSIRTFICSALRSMGKKVVWYEVLAFQKDESLIEKLVCPFLGTPGSVWGNRSSIDLADFFTFDWKDWKPSAREEVVVLAGTGAALCGWKAPVVYIDLPKNELQYRMRAASATNLGSTRVLDFAEMYKRSYFVDWPVLNKHRIDIKERIEVVADGQWATEINWTLATSISKGLQSISNTIIRNRPWFEPGVWGGQWMKNHIPGISSEEINYAWSFELIAPENGLVFVGDNHLLEIAFDWLLEQDGKNVLGLDAERFGVQFPIRFDFLDTIDGDNLSIQCHPSLSYIQEHFGETITQDETYYILDKAGDASVYLGFQEDIDPLAFRSALQRSQAEKVPIDIERYVQKLPAAKHGLYLIPNRTVHGAGKGNLVLEISATPYIFTFKMYDWMRLDLNGRPRPINIEHAFHNLDFTRKGETVASTLISRPVVISDREGVLLEELPTHPDLFYRVQRINLSSSVAHTTVYTEGKFHLLMLVEGDRIWIKPKHGIETEVRYAETFLIPAAAESYELINLHRTPLKIVLSSIKK
jgi:predicted NBD/HSP70 family sugar kinase/mannose-6-phosphate isomerase class I